MLLVFSAAMVMALPSIRGGFLDGDDILLVRDHVLVNRPSIEHAAELFRIVHRDLYQPVALLSFSIDFAVMRGFGLTPDVGGPTSGAWIFHLTNILLHSFNAVLVYLLLRRVTEQVPLAIVAAVLFAIHPLGVESIAWLNGRMMLLSTFFALASLVAMESWAKRPRWWVAALVVVLVALCMMSKVRICLPILMLAPFLYRRQWPPRRWWAVWVVVGVVTAMFVVINVQASSSMIEQGAQSLQGSRIARTVMALGWYWTRTIVPMGLSPMHPAPKLMSWSHEGMVAALIVVAAVVVVTIMSMRKTRVGWVGMLWFMAAIAVTLPLLPSRNILVAERYAYLPNIGIYWILAAALLALRRLPAFRIKPVRVAVPLAIGVIFVGASWQTIADYRDNVAKSGRIASVYPDDGALRVRYAWALQQTDPPRYDDAITEAKKVLSDSDDEIASEAHQVVGMSLLRSGDVAGAIEALRQAVELADEQGFAYERLGLAYEEAGRLDDALACYRKCVELMPSYNPGLIRLAEFNQANGNIDDAAGLYEKAIANNEFEVPAIEGLAEIEIQRGQHKTALVRLGELLNWMPENIAARINAGVCLVELGQLDAARGQYEIVLQQNPDAKAAVMNLAVLKASRGDVAGAINDLRDYLVRHPDDKDAADSLNSLNGVSGAVAFLNAGQPEQAIESAQALIDKSLLGDPATFDMFCTSLQKYAESHNRDPWPYYLLTMACHATGRDEAAKASAGMFKSMVGDPEWHKRVDELLSR